MKAKPSQREAKTESDFTSLVKDDGNLCIKWGINGYPDKVIYMACGLHFFIEFKRQGKEPRKLQAHKIKELQELGHNVYVCDSYEKAITIYNKYKAKCTRTKRNKSKKAHSNISKPSAKK